MQTAQVACPIISNECVVIEMNNPAKTAVQNLFPQSYEILQKKIADISKKIEQLQQNPHDKAHIYKKSWVPMLAVSLTSTLIGCFLGKNFVADPLIPIVNTNLLAFIKATLTLGIGFSIGGIALIGANLVDSTLDLRRMSQLLEEAKKSEEVLKKIVYDLEAMAEFAEAWKQFLENPHQSLIAPLFEKFDSINISSFIFPYNLNESHSEKDVKDLCHLFLLSNITATVQTGFIDEEFNLYMTGLSSYLSDLLKLDNCQPQTELPFKRPGEQAIKIFREKYKDWNTRYLAYQMEDLTRGAFNVLSKAS